MVVSRSNTSLHRKVVNIVLPHTPSCTSAHVRGQQCRKAVRKRGTTIHCIRADPAVPTVRRCTAHALCAQQPPYHPLHWKPCARLHYLDFTEASDGVAGLAFCVTSAAVCADDDQLCGGCTGYCALELSVLEPGSFVELTGPVTPSAAWKQGWGVGGGGLRGARAV